MTQKNDLMQKKQLLILGFNQNKPYKLMQQLNIKF